jgi:hypothetical protein
MLTTINNAQGQKDYRSICDDWKQQTANYVIVGQTSNNESDYIWEEKTNQLQGIHIYVNPSEIVPVYIQQNNNVINFSTRSSDSYAYTYITRLKFCINEGNYTELYSGSSKQDVVWENSSDFFPSLGDYTLKLIIMDEFGVEYSREYLVKVIPASSRLYKDNFGNTLRLWESDYPSIRIPIVFSEGFDAYETNTQEMYCYASFDLVTCLLNNGFNVYFLDNRFGTQDIRNNAAVFNSAVRYVSSLNDDTQVIAGGVSMGGMISRYGFAKAEQEGNPLPANIFISVDSPQQGAVISKSLQDYKRENQSGDGFAEHALNNEAAKQLLNYSTYDPSGEIHNAFYSELNALNSNGYPHQTEKNIGISFSTKNPNPNYGIWIEVSGTGPFVGTESFTLEDEEKVPGSYLPIDLTTMDPMIIRLPVYWWIEFLFPIIPLYYPTITINRISDPTYIPYNSALDIVNNQSKFDVTIEPNQTSYHDVLPFEIVEVIVTELVLSDKFIQDITIDFDYNIIGRNVFVGNNVTDNFPYGDVIINNGANVTIVGSNSIILKEGVVVSGESTNTILEIDQNYSASCNSKQYISGLASPDNDTSSSDNGYHLLNTDFPELMNRAGIDKGDLVYPNPSMGLFSFNSADEVESFYVYNSFGIIVLSDEGFNKNSISIDLTNQPQGIYYLKVVCNSELKTYRLMKL